jgi:hypothetical protein
VPVNLFVDTSRDLLAHTCNTATVHNGTSDAYQSSLHSHEQWQL